MSNKEWEEKVIESLKKVFDPEIPVNIYELGLIYKIDIDDKSNVKIEMTLTAPTCPIADSIVEDVKAKVKEIEEAKEVDVELVFEPPWEMSMMSEAAQLELGLL